MPRQNTSPSDFPPAILEQIALLASRIVAARKQRGETQAHWAEKLGISQPTMARLERGDPAIATATYVMCLWHLNPQLDLRVLLPATVAESIQAPPPQPQKSNSLKVETNTPTPEPTPTPPPHSPIDDFASLLQQWSPAAL